MSENKLDWKKIPGIGGGSDRFVAEGKIREFQVGNDTICVVKHKGELFAVRNKCPHNGVKLSEGYMDDEGTLFCPLHRYGFCVKDGKNVTGEGYYLKNYPVEVREDGVYVGFPKLSGWFL